MLMKGSSEFPGYFFGLNEDLSNYSERARVELDVHAATRPVF
jgi:hypothetical protein